MIFRFDDVCLNTCMSRLNRLAEIVFRSVEHVHVQYAVSPCCSDVAELVPPLDEFVFQPIFKAYSDHSKFYRMDRHGIPKSIPSSVQVTSHGIVHCDHRLMHKDAQELSILLSCSLLDTSVFTPPFNKWNGDTVDICMRHGIQLQKFEDGWRSAEYNRFDPKISYWYAHGRTLTEDGLERWFQA